MILLYLFVRKDKIDVSRLDFRIGQIITVKQHPDADSLYVEEGKFNMTS